MTQTQRLPGASASDFWMKVNLRPLFCILLQDFPHWLQKHFGLPQHSSKFFELTFSLSEILMKASCFVALAECRFHPKREAAAPVSLGCVQTPAPPVIR